MTPVAPKEETTVKFSMIEDNNASMRKSIDHYHTEVHVQDQELNASYFNKDLKSLLLQLNESREIFDEIYKEKANIKEEEERKNSLGRSVSMSRT